MKATPQWSHLTSGELQALVDGAGGRLVAVVVVGAIEQHGPHLGLGTDTEIGQGLLSEALCHTGPHTSVVVMPAIGVGASEEHNDFVGTISLSPTVLEGVLEAYGQALHRAGIRRLVVVNAHGGNAAVIESAALAMRRAFGLLVAKAYYPKFEPLPDLPDASELKQGLHGGQVETALMHVMAPELVRPNKAKAFDLAHPPFAGEAPVAWLAKDLHAQGVAGKANLATAEQGQALRIHYGKGLARAIDALADHPLPANDQH